MAERELPELRDMPKWKRDLLRPVSRAAYAAAVGSSDDEVRDIVTAALACARRNLSS